MQETVPDAVFETADEVELIDIAARRAARAAAGGQGLRPGAGAPRDREFLPQGQPDRAARARAAHHRRPRRRGDARVPRRPRASAPPGRRASACWSRSAPTSRPSAWCAPASAWRRRCTPSGSWSTSRRRTCCACPRTSATGASRCCASPSRSAPRPVTLGGSSAGEELANYARTRNVTRILIGRPRRSLWRRLFRPSTYGELLAQHRGHRPACGRRRRRGGGAAQPVPRAQPRLPAGARSAGQRQGALAGLRLERGRGRRLHAARPGDDAGLRAGQRRDGLPARGGADRRALRPRAGGRDLGARRRLVRFLLRAAAAHVRGERHPVPAHLRDHARGGADHLQPHRQRAPAGERRRPPRAAHRAALRDEPRARGDARRAERWRASRCAT